jgi:hypothetical protein
MAIPLRKRYRCDSRLSWATKDLAWLTTRQDRSGMDGWGGWIYAIAEDGTPLVKIGYTRAGIRERLYNVATSIHASVTLVGCVAMRTCVTMVEQQVHVLLAAQHIEGEWFYTHMNQQMLVNLVSQTPTGARGILSH